MSEEAELRSRVVELAAQLQAARRELDRRTNSVRQQQAQVAGGDPRLGYLVEHGIPGIIDSLLVRLMDERPADPRRFMADFLLHEEDASVAPGKPPSSAPASSRKASSISAAPSSSRATSKARSEGSGSGRPTPDRKASAASSESSAASSSNSGAAGGVKSKTSSSSSSDANSSDDDSGSSSTSD
eukprot:TRINITY_DN12254_c0_g1_i1.p1 TRINITY_DN12254_c0_g1~~TRINITY_DN12254_c0_g1_i1.p1  ORF type:complete len:196 (-),score=28.38 TRINITY_DN12254_c0_g1_i1:151-705(-)